MHEIFANKIYSIMKKVCQYKKFFKKIICIKNSFSREKKRAVYREIVRKFEQSLKNRTHKVRKIRQLKSDERFGALFFVQTYKNLSKTNVA